jgi:hypothetical protein
MESVGKGGHFYESGVTEQLGTRRRIHADFRGRNRSANKDKGPPQLRAVAISLNQRTLSAPNGGYDIRFRSRVNVSIQFLCKLACDDIIDTLQRANDVANAGKQQRAYEAKQFITQTRSVYAAFTGIQHDDGSPDRKAIQHFSGEHAITS